MPLDTTRANTMTESMTTAFQSIGHGAPVTMPRGGTKNTGPIAWEYLVSSILASAAEARKELARRNAVKAGVLPDHRKEPRVVGTEAVVYEDGIVRIDLTVTTAGTRLDVGPLWDALERAGIARSKLDRLVAVHTLTNAAPHKFKPSLVTR